MTMNYKTVLALALFTAACGDTRPDDDPLIIITTDQDDPRATDDANEPDGDDDANAEPGDETPDLNNDVVAPANNAVDPPTNNTVDPPANNTIEEPADPCGNGVIEDGEVCDGDCPSSCDDADPCTQDSMSGSPDACTAVCAYVDDAACDAWTGGYTGTYTIEAEEKLGSTVINSMTCTGNFSIEVDRWAPDAVAGTADCVYSGGLTIFDSNQTAEITGQVNPDGSIRIRITHDSGAPNKGFFNVDGTVANGTLVVDDTSSYTPHPMAAVAWEVAVKLN